MRCANKRLSTVAPCFRCSLPGWHDCCYPPKAKIELAVADAVAEQVIEAITRMGKIGDGKIFVSELSQAIRITFEVLAHIRRWEQVKGPIATIQDYRCSSAFAQRRAMVVRSRSGITLIQLANERIACKR